MNDLIGALLDGDQEQAAAEAEKLLSENYKKEAVVKDGIEAAMKKLDAKCTAV